VVVAHPRALATALGAATARTRYTRLAEMVSPDVSREPD
jgi:hypothetical protein